LLTTMAAAPVCKAISASSGVMIRLMMKGRFRR
jgi:hypothetical protein